MAGATWLGGRSTIAAISRTVARRCPRFGQDGCIKKTTGLWATFQHLQAYHHSGNDNAALRDELWAESCEVWPDDAALRTLPLRPTRAVSRTPKSELGKVKSEPEVEALAENAASGSNGMCTAERLETLRGLFKAQATQNLD